MSAEPDIPDPAASVLSELRKLIAGAVLFNDQVAGKVGLSHGDMQSVHLLQLHGPLTAGQLAELTGLSTGAVTAVVDRLERLGFASRRPHESDRRKVVIVPHEERIGAVLGPHYRAQAEGVARTVARFTPRQLRTVAEFMAALNATRSTGGSGSS